MQSYNWTRGYGHCKNITLKMGQCPAQSYVDRILKHIKEEKFDATDIITPALPLDQGKHAYDIFDENAFCLSS